MWVGPSAQGLNPMITYLVYVGCHLPPLCAPSTRVRVWVGAWTASGPPRHKPRPWAMPERHIGEPLKMPSVWGIWMGITGLSRHAHTRV